ncbi:N-lysine methyltransferase KMT5A-A-like [Amphiprion ocellaris]|uniref:N-lysine methyltransferase KMT5A-A-like n=1 Tax=Amphiprion ocellaris TaxID=80972 RepID=UPI002411522A|nr:N-lysine methyltransferase KMT5A-A-like [Amphiprion ocellaris]
MSKRKNRIQPVDDETSYILSSRDKPGFIERFINSNKGRGVFVTQPIEPGAFLLEYRGELMSVEECRSRHYSEKRTNKQTSPVAAEIEMSPIDGALHENSNRMMLVHR